MPTYEYECGSCGHRYELFQLITARPIKKCPECGRRTAVRLIGTGSSIIFKGSGFYETDYRSESYKKAAKAEAEAASGGDKDAAGDKKDKAPAKKTSSDSKNTSKKPADDKS